MKKEKVIVVMPAYNAEKTLEKTYNDVPKQLIDEIILVDDVSQDKTVEISKKLGITTIVHEKNTGYGGNQKTCFKTALSHGADIIIMIHPDHQYDPKKIPEVLKAFQQGADVVRGSRTLIKGDAKKGGMSLYRRFGNFLTTITINLMLGTKLTDVPTGYIAYRREVLETIPFLKNDDGWTFDEELIIQCVFYNFNMKEIAIPTRYEDDSSSIGILKSIKYGLNILKRLIRYKLHKYKIAKFYLLE